MTETIKTWRAEPLTWGQGPRLFEMFLEPTCPFSARAFAKLDATLAGAGSDKVSIAARREEFEFTKHCSGPNMDATPKDIIARLEDYSGLQLADAFAIPNLDREIKWHTKYARQNGIHVSPTFMIDGLVQSDMASGENVSAWVSRLSAN